MAQKAVFAGAANRSNIDTKILNQNKELASQKKTPSKSDGVGKLF